MEIFPDVRIVALEIGTEMPSSTITDASKTCAAWQYANERLRLYGTEMFPHKFKSSCFTELFFPSRYSFLLLYKVLYSAKNFAFSLSSRASSILLKKSHASCQACWRTSIISLICSFTKIFSSTCTLVFVLSKLIFFASSRRSFSTSSFVGLLKAK